MASNSEIIREFLVSVGVQTDERGLKRFGQTVGRITATVVEFAKEMAIAAAAVSAGVTKIASEFEDLYYATQRLKSSADNIKAFGFGVSQMGGDAKAARASLEAFASFMRSNPLGEGMVRGLGVETRTATGDIREYADQMRDIGRELKKMPYWAAKLRAEMLGIDEGTLQALMRDTDLWSDRYRKMVADAGVDMDKMSKDLTELTQYFRLLKAEIEIGLYKAISKIDPQLLRLSILIGAVAGGLAIVATLLGPVVALVLALGVAVALLADDYAGWKAGSDSLINWKQWSGEIEAALAAFKNLGDAFSDLWDALDSLGQKFNFTFGDQAQAIARAFANTMIDAVDLIAVSIKAVAALLRGDLAGAAKYAAEFIDIGNRDVTRKNPSVTPSKPANQNLPPINWGSPGGGGNRSGSGTGASRSAYALQFLMRNGYTREQALGIVAGMNAENAGLNPKAVGPKVGLNGQKTSGAFGIGQWLGPRKAELFKRYGSNPTFDQQLQFLLWELSGGDAGMAKVKGQGSAHGAMRSYILDGMRPGKGAETTGDLARGARYIENARLGADGAGRSVTINANTNIKVEGNPDAKETARAVGDTVDRRNSDLVRNTRTAIR